MPDPVPKCPFCGKVKVGAVIAANPSMPPPAANLQKLDLTPLLASDSSDSVFWRIPRPLHVALLVGALPLIIPSLILTRLQAKRWGRVPVPMIVFDGLLFFAIVLGMPRVVPFFLVAVACTITLFVLRYRYLESGIFLGYSNLVTFALMVAGVMVIYGLVTNFSFNEMKEAVGSTDEREVGIKRIVDGAVGNEQMMLVRAKLLWPDRLQHVVTDKGSRFFAMADGPVEGVTSLWVPLEGGDDAVFAVVPPGADEKTRVYGKLFTPRSHIDDILEWRRNRHPGKSFNGVLYGIDVAEAEVSGGKAPKPERNPVGLVVLTLGVLLALGTSWKATGDE